MAAPHPQCTSKLSVVASLLTLPNYPFNASLTTPVSLRTR
jgi:hypothetical protein